MPPNTVNYHRWRRITHPGKEMPAGLKILVSAVQSRPSPPFNSNSCPPENFSRNDFVPRFVPNSGTLQRIPAHEALCGGLPRARRRANAPAVMEDVWSLWLSLRPWSTVGLDQDEPRTPDRCRHVLGRAWRYVVLTRRLAEAANVQARAAREQAEAGRIAANAAAGAGELTIASLLVLGVSHSQCDSRPCRRPGRPRTPW